MAEQQRPPLRAFRTSPGSEAFKKLLQWPSGSGAFYESQIVRLLTDDIVRRLREGSGKLWIFRDAADEIVGFGTIDRCREYGILAGGKPHLYIPLVAVHPAHQGRGHGKTVVEFLIREAIQTVLQSDDLAVTLFLDVYQANQTAIGLYQKFGFVILNPDAPISDPEEKNAGYFVMGVDVSAAGPR